MSNAISRAARKRMTRTGEPFSVARRAVIEERDRERAAAAQRPVFAMGDGVELPVARAPWTAGQVSSLNDFQAAGGFHPYTCGNDDCPGTAGDDEDGERASLVAREDGWHCPACDYTQDWALAFIADGGWRDWTGIEVRVNGGEPVRGPVGFIPDEFLRAGH